jgi:hypothetical protein
MNPLIALNILAPPAPSASGIHEVSVSHSAEIERAEIGPSLAAVMRGEHLAAHLPACATLIWLLTRTPVDIRATPTETRAAEIAALPDVLTPPAFRALLMECLHALARAHAPAPDGDETPDAISADAPASKRKPSARAAIAKKKPLPAKPPESMASDGSRRSRRQSMRRTVKRNRSVSGAIPPT